MDELLNELKGLSNSEKKEFLNELLKKKRKDFCFLVAQKNCYYNQHNFEKLEETKKEIKNLKKEINYLQELKNSIVEEAAKKVVTKVKKEKEVKISLSNEDVELLNKYIKDEQLLNLTNFTDIKVPLLEYLLQLKQQYQFYLKRENKKIKSINKSIELLNNLSTVPSNLLEQLQEHKGIKKIFNKIIKYLDKLIRLEYKKINKITREQKRLTETLFAEKYGIKEIDSSKPYTVEELYSVYYQLVFKDKDISYVEQLLEKFPDLYKLKIKKRLFYQDILDKYENCLLNKNYLGNTKKELEALQELEYYQSLILKYLTHSFEFEEYNIVEITIKKVEKILNIMSNNDIYLEKSKVILEQLSYIKEIIKLGNLKANSIDNITEVKGEYIFSIDNGNAKVIEDAISIKKEHNNYHISFYTPDVISFIESSSVLEKRAYERYKSSGKKGYALPHDTVQFFRLIQGRKKRVIGYHFVIDENGNLKDLKIEKNIIKLYNSYSFEDFTSILNEDNNAILLKELYCLLENKDKDEFVNSSNILKSLILNCGTILGKYLNTKNIPCIYKDLNNGMISSIPTSDYYVEFTSPLRSYISMMNQRVLINGRVLKNVEEQCKELNESKQKIK